MDLSGAIFDDDTLGNIVFIQFFFAKTFLSECIKTDFLCEKRIIKLEGCNSEDI